MISQIDGIRHRRVLTQAGSIPKRWNKEQLRKCGAIGTTEPRHLDLQGDIHPVFSNWEDADPGLRRELEQPLLLTSRLLEAAGLPWASDFLAHDVFVKDYPGRAPSCRCSFTHSAAAPRDHSEIVPTTIVRHHRAPWASSELKDEWVQAAGDKLKSEVANSLTWGLDADMFRERGWAGYTCRHPRNGHTLDELDRYETIRSWDERCEDQRQRNLTILMAEEFPKRLAELRREGNDNSEEYLLTAFMAAVTILHELGHAIYWKDCRALTRDLREPYYGADLQMELGDSFVASIFGGWVPVPIRHPTDRGESLNFSGGIAWRQVLSWDFHRLRPKYRTHYSIPVDFIARLFSEDCWSEAEKEPLRSLIRPQTLEPAIKDVGICSSIAANGTHSTAAIADFHCTGQGWMWDRLPGTRFRIPQYDGYLCPDLDLPIATDDVIEEPQARPPLQPSPMPPLPTAEEAEMAGVIISDDVLLSPKPEMFPKPPRRHVPKNRKKPEVWFDLNEKQQQQQLPKKQTAPSFVRLAKEEHLLSQDGSEISLDELRNRLSRLLGVSINELERYFEASRCA